MTESNTRDPGLQAERTRLAWRRTGFSATMVTVLLAHHGANHGETVSVVPVLAAACSVLVCAAVNFRREYNLMVPHPKFSQLSMAILTLSVAGSTSISTAVEFWRYTAA
jgi:uncharacterized membrane protein YidH (DUF202 family)